MALNSKPTMNTWHRLGYVPGHASGGKARPASRSYKNYIDRADHALISIAHFVANIVSYSRMVGVGEKKYFVLTEDGQPVARFVPWRSDDAEPSIQFHFKPKAASGDLVSSFTGVARMAISPIGILRGHSRVGMVLPLPDGPV